MFIHIYNSQVSFNKMQAFFYSAKGMGYYITLLGSIKYTHTHTHDSTKKLTTQRNNAQIVPFWEQKAKMFGAWDPPSTPQFTSLDNFLLCLQHS